jgi:nicotinamidase-related amidase
MTLNIDKFWLDRDKALLLIIDVQERLIPAMPKKPYQEILGSIELLLKGAREIDLPVVVTEQYPKGLGHTVPELEEACRDCVVTKVSFGSCGEPSFLEELKKQGRNQIIVTGMEAHVCVYQTVLGLLGAGYDVHLVRDGVISRRKSDYRNSLELARDAGAVVTTAETVLFQILRAATAPEFKAVSALVKNRPTG